MVDENMKQDAMNLTQEVIKMKASAATTGGGFFVTMLSFLSEYQHAITSACAIIGLLLTFVGLCFTVLHQKRVREIRERELHIKQKHMQY